MPERPPGPSAPSPALFRAQVIGWLGACAALLTACPASDSAAKAEAARVSRAVSALRNAENAEKPRALEALRGSACAAEDVCRVRSACLSAYELHVRSLSAAAALGADAPDGAAVVGELERVERDLGRARELARTCTDLEGELIRRYRL